MQQLAQHRLGRAAARPGRSPALQVHAAQKVSSKKQVVCSKTLTAKPQAVEQVMKMCRSVTEYSQARMQDRSSGIHEFSCSKDRWEENVFHFWERYESNAAMGKHNTSGEVKGFMEKVQPLLEQPIGMALYEYNNGKIGPSCVQGGPKGEGGLDDATGASGAAGGASMKQTSGTVDLTQINDEEDEDMIMGNFAKDMSKQVENVFSSLKNVFKMPAGRK